jgi:hippurate hydrolase
MDGLPITEFNTFGHASVTIGKMHACGHDGHTTMLLSAAHYLAQHRNFDGTIYLIFQPAEEGGGGAREMIKDGLFDLFPMEAVFGIHNWPGLEAGQFAVNVGPAFASSNEFKITIKGKGAHAAMPHNGIDPVPIACQMVQAFQTIITRNKRPIDAAVISVTKVHAGEAVNVIPDSCEVQGTVRTFTLDVLDMIERRMCDVAHSICSAFDATCDFNFRRNYPPTINHAAESEFVRGVLNQFVGAENVKVFEPTMGAEDFAFYLLEKPGCYFVIGNGDGAHRDGSHGGGPCMLHNPSYDFNDELIPLGASMWVRLAESWLATAR